MRAECSTNVAMHLKIYILILSAICSNYGVYCEQQGVVSSGCTRKVTCASCIQESGCAWCSEEKPEAEKNFIRCQNVKSMKCSKKNLINPEPSVEPIRIKDVPLSSAKGDVVQIRPQRLRVTLRRGQEYKINFQYSQAEDYPVDLYYLMDLSASMADDKDKLSLLGNRLASVMKNITKNFALGFGSFVDKTEMPFVSTLPEKLKQPCDMCAPPYSFRNHMPLTGDTDKFTAEVRRAPISGNLDSPEGGFDAIMQAIVCQPEIGWRTRARHLLVFSTDAGFHIAGDGKLAGVVEPNDGLCHLNSEGLYTHALEYDYPSISMINKVAKKHNINLIFAVANSQSDVYKQLQSRIEGAEFGVLSDDSSNVVDLVRGVYTKLVDSVVITDNAGPGVEVKYYTSCLRGGPPKETRECKDVRFGRVVDFTAVIKVLNCPSDKNWKPTIEIKPRDFNESLVVELDVACKCDCEKTDSPAGKLVKDRACSSYGWMECGICACEDGRIGKACECNATLSDSVGDVSSGDDDSGCKPSSDSLETCSGHGTCKCGRCDCHKRQGEGEYSGTFCECNNFSCNRLGGLMCSGRGQCVCGTCVCDRGWTGDTCECPISNDMCISPVNQELCSGHGECRCGKCHCASKPFRYTGPYCGECPNCLGQRCNEFTDCVECQAYRSGRYSVEECEWNCRSFQTEIVPKIEDNKMEEYKVCRAPDAAGCTILFKYIYNIDTTIDRVYAQRNKECPGEVNLLVVTASVIGTIVLAGLILLLIWRCLAEIHDRREYVRFEKERSMARWDRGDNPLYKPSTSTFKNPTFQQDPSAADN